MLNAGNPSPSRGGQAGSHCLVFYVSGHGFGHASRDIEVINAIRRRCPGCRIVVRTEVPLWFLHGSVDGPVDVQPVQVDTGMAQVDSLTIDEDATAAAAARFYATFDERVETEARQLSALRAAVVVGDIPPLAFAAAARAGIPSVAVGNFTWDWIYAALPAFDVLAPGVLPLIRDAYRHAPLALRLPFHGGFQPLAAVVQDAPLVARRSTRAASDTRRLLALQPGSPVVMPSFGGLGLRLPYDAIAASCGCGIVLTEHQLDGATVDHPGIRVVTERERGALGLRYEDLVAAADVIISKPGYGIVSECVANATALLFTSRERFAEEHVFLREMPRVLRCRYIDPAEIHAGRWREPLHALLDQPPPPESMRTDGAAVVADAILDVALH